MKVATKPLEEGKFFILAIQPETADEVQYLYDLVYNIPRHGLVVGEQEDYDDLTFAGVISICRSIRAQLVEVTGAIGRRFRIG